MWIRTSPTTHPMRYPSDPADLRIGSPEWRRFMVQEVGMREAWLDFAASGANLPFELADREGRFDDMMQMLGGGQGAGERQNQMRGYLINHMRMLGCSAGKQQERRYGQPPCALIY